MIKSLLRHGEKAMLIRDDEKKEIRILLVSASDDIEKTENCTEYGKVSCPVYYIYSDTELRKGDMVLNGVIYNVFASEKLMIGNKEICFCARAEGGLA